MICPACGAQLFSPAPPICPHCRSSTAGAASPEPTWATEARAQQRRATRFIAYGLVGLILVIVVASLVGHRSSSGGTTNSPAFQRVVSYCRQDVAPVFLAQHAGPIDPNDPEQQAQVAALINRCILQRTGNNNLGGYMSGKPLAPDQPIPTLQPEEPYTNP